MRRRRYIRRGVTVDEDEDEDAFDYGNRDGHAEDEDGSTASSSRPSSRRLTGKAPGRGRRAKLG